MLKIIYSFTVYGSGGKSKGKGCAGILLDKCINDANSAGMNGVAIVTSEWVWLAGKDLLIKHGFESVAEAPPFNLMVKKFSDAPSPSFTGDYERKANRYGQGLTVIRSDQCPYIPDATNTSLEFARQCGIQSQVIELKTCQDVHDLALSPYGVFSIVYDCRLLSYHSLLPKDLSQMIGNSKE